MPVELRHVRVVVGDVGAGVAQQLDELLGRRLARVADVGLVGDAEDEDPRPRERLLRPWFSACEITERQKYGMLLLTSPASSMKRVVEVVLARLPGEVVRVERDAVPAEARARAGTT